jgi:hypothetical protein
VHRFFFHLRRGETVVVLDNEGAEFESLEEAYLESFAGARELWPELVLDRKDPRQYAFDIADCDGEVLMNLPFTEIVECCRRVGPASRGASPHASGAALNQRALVDAFENARKLSQKSAELCEQLSAARRALQELKQSAQSANVWSSAGQ